MRKQSVLRFFSLFLIGTMLCVGFGGCQKKSPTDNVILNAALGNHDYVQTAYTTVASNLKKEETVYVNAKSDGTVYQVQVTDWLHTDMPQVRAEDKSNLQNIQNVKTLTEPIVVGNQLYWDMDTTDLYYSGLSKEEPPIVFHLRYFLNDEEMTAEEIAGKSGDVKITIDIENRLTKEVNVQGKTYTVSCPMFVAGGTMLPEDTFTDIAIDYGTSMSDGAKQIVFFAGVPGMDESLGLTEYKVDDTCKSFYTNTYTITAHTECFQLGNFMLAAMPFSSIGSIGNGGAPQSADDIKELLTDVKNVQTAMKGLDLQRVIDLLYGDANRIESMMQAINEASMLYTENEQLFKVMGEYMTEDNLKKLGKLMEDLEKTDMEAISKTLSDPKLKLLLQLLPQLSQSLSEVSVLADDLNDVIPIFQSLSKDMDNPEVQKSLENLPQTIKKLKGILDVLEKNKDILKAVGDLTDADSEAQIQTVISTANKYATLGDLSQKEAELLAGRAKEWIQFGNTYDIFTQRTDDASSTVSFFYKTDSIAAPAGTTAAVGTPEKPDNKFVAFFKNLFS